MGVNLAVQGTELEREGGEPLLAVSTMAGERLVNASIIDPQIDPDPVRRGLARALTDPLAQMRPGP